jgi:hypothetical protein
LGDAEVSATKCGAKLGPGGGDKNSTLAWYGNGHARHAKLMTGGFAVIATPVKYRETGVMTFIISQQGIVFQRDLGADTAKVTAAVQE